MHVHQHEEAGQVIYHYPVQCQYCTGTSALSSPLSMLIIPIVCMYLDLKLNPNVNKSTMEYI